METVCKNSESDTYVSGAVEEYLKLSRDMSNNLKMIENKMRNHLGDFFDLTMSDLIEEAWQKTPEDDGDIAATLMVMSCAFDKTDINFYMILAALSYYMDHYLSTRHFQ
ncbi:hypothetical protein [Sessilibacter sp. MAH2]